MGEPASRPGCVAVVALVLVVLSQLPAWGIYSYWLFRDGGASLLGLVAPPFLIGGWLIAIPLLIWSPWARRKIVLWIALAFGLIGQAIYGTVIGYF